jgi:hypothetical protein
MKKEHSISARTGALSLLLALVFLPHSLRAAEKPNFTGTWQRNDQQSDDARQKMREAMEAARAGGPGGFPGSHRNGSRRRDYPSGDEQRRGDRAGHMQDMLTPPETLMVALNDSELSLTDEKGRTRTFYTDGRKVEQQTPFGQTVTQQTHWEGDEIMVEEAMPRGDTHRETYALSPDGKQLIVTLTLENRRFGQPVTIRQVYDHAGEKAQ